MHSVAELLIGCPTSATMSANDALTIVAAPSYGPSAANGTGPTHRSAELKSNDVSSECMSRIGPVRACERATLVVSGSTMRHRSESGWWLASYPPSRKSEPSCHSSMWPYRGHGAPESISSSCHVPPPAPSRPSKTPSASQWLCATRTSSSPSVSLMERSGGSNRISPGSSASGLYAHSSLDRCCVPAILPPKRASTP